MFHLDVEAGGSGDDPVVNYGPERVEGAVGLLGAVGDRDDADVVAGDTGATRGGGLRWAACRETNQRADERQEGERSPCE